MHIKKTPFFWLLILSTLLLTGLALLGRKNIYQSYTEKENLKTSPLLAEVFEGICEGVMPWQISFSPGYTDLTPEEVLAELPGLLATETIHSPIGSDADSDHPSSGEQANQENDKNVITDSDSIVSDSDNSSETGTSHDPDTGTDTTADTGNDTTVTNTPGKLNPDGTPVTLGAYGLPVVHYAEPVDNDYFADAIFIGDSRTRSLELYSGIDTTTFFAGTGLTIYSVLEEKLTPSGTHDSTTVIDYLTEHQFRKVYLMLGINELGRGTQEQFVKEYKEVIAAIQKLQPNAIIIVQAILHVSESKEKENTYINNEGIVTRNLLLKNLADNLTIFYLDANEAICDPNGFLIDQYTFDGVHLQAKYVSIWVDWLKSHAIKTEPDPVPTVN